ncbi:4Fe-4S dicluster domain-containing protein [Vibrio hannami]|uniref:4Fe-4S dicluster domain-containing protein n=1 Tax=Vibrio hannami TaxID=2717094 RepID=UPI003EBB8910
MTPFLDTADRNVELANQTFVQHDKPTLLRKIRDAGIVGAGGAGFPTYVKMQAEAEIYLVNAAECEPMLKVDQQLMAQTPDKLIRGLLYGMMMTNAKEGVIALKQKYQPAIDALTPLLPENVRIHILPDVYPAGDEVITIWMATGRRVAAGALPASVGVMVNNVQTLIQVADALESEASVTHRTLTINGAVAKPVTLTVPIGISLQEALDLAGGTTILNPAFISGGPMMGKLVEDLSTPVTKTTGGLLVFPDDHILIRRQKQSDQSVINMAKTVCEQCRLCTELCPRHLVGHELPPSELVKAISYENVAKPSVLMSALTCSECGVCEAYACPVDISPMRVNKILKKKLREQGARYEGELRPADPMAEYRMVPVKRLVAKLNIENYAKAAPLEPLDWQPDQIVIPVQQHIGAPSKPVVSIGDKVSLGQCIAQPDDEALGVSIHASINGTVSNISDSAITIIRE